MGGAGVYQQGYGTYAPTDQGPYAGYYVSLCTPFIRCVSGEADPEQAGGGTPADGSQPGPTPVTGGATPAQGGDAAAQYAAYWAAYGYDVNDPQCESVIRERGLELIERQFKHGKRRNMGSRLRSHRLSELLHHEARRLYIGEESFGLLCMHFHVKSQLR